MAILTTTIIGTIAGIFSSAIPEIVQIFKSRQDTLNEVKLLEAKTKYQEKLSELKVKELDIQADIDESKSIYTSDNSYGVTGFMGALRSSVRPIITYFFFAVFIAIKVYAFYYGMFIQSIDVINLLPIVWDTETASLFGAIMGFWFGTRNIERAFIRVKGQ